MFVFVFVFTCVVIEKSIGKMNFEQAAEKGEVEQVKKELLEGNLSQGVIARGFGAACREGKTQVVELLLKDERVDPSAYDNYAIRQACKEGHVGIFRFC